MKNLILVSLSISRFENLCFPYIFLVESTKRLLVILGINTIIQDCEQNNYVIGVHPFNKAYNFNTMMIQRSIQDFI